MPPFATHTASLATSLSPQGSGLPSLLQSKLNAPRVLRINKVSDYVRRKMEEHGIQLQEEPLYWVRPCMLLHRTCLLRSPRASSSAGHGVKPVHA